MDRQDRKQGPIGVQTPGRRNSGDEIRFRTRETSGSSREEEALVGRSLGQERDNIEPWTSEYGRLLCDLRTWDLSSTKNYVLGHPPVCRPYSEGTKSSWIFQYILAIPTLPVAPRGRMLPRN